VCAYPCCCCPSLGKGGWLAGQEGQEREGREPAEHQVACLPCDLSVCVLVCLPCCGCRYAGREYGREEDVERGGLMVKGVRSMWQKVSTWPAVSVCMHACWSLHCQGWQLPVREHAACISQNAVHGFYL
jgi:hypothetical protein